MEDSRETGTAPRAREQKPGAAALALLALIPLVLGTGGCTKQVMIATEEVNIGDGREFEVEFSGDRMVRGRLLSGSMVKYREGDSLFTAEVDDVSPEFIELSRRVLITDRTEWTHLRESAENAWSTVDRPELGGALLARDDIESVALLTTDRRRILTEALFWAAFAITAGYAGLAN
jgi:hypothetical protein